MKDLVTSLREWVAAGLIDQDQATAIRSHEAAPTDERRVPLIAEVLGYLGGSLALIAAFILAGEFWPDLETWARLLLVGAGTIAFLAAGWFVKDNQNEAIHRLASFSWALATVGVAFFFGLLANDVLDMKEETTALIASASGLAIGYVLYRLSPRSLQQILLGGAAVGHLADPAGSPRPTASGVLRPGRLGNRNRLAVPGLGQSPQAADHRLCARVVRRSDRPAGHAFR